MAKIIQFSALRSRAGKNHGGTSKEGSPPHANPVAKAHRSSRWHGAGATKAQIIELRRVTPEELEGLLNAVEQGTRDSIGHVLLTFGEAEELLRGGIKR